MSNGNLLGVKRPGRGVDHQPISLLSFWAFMFFSKVNFTLTAAVINDTITRTPCPYHFNEVKLILNCMYRKRRKGVMMMVTVMMVVMHRILNQARCLSFESSLPQFFMKLLAKPKCARRKMCTTISLLQLFGFFFQKAFFIAAQRILPFITPFPISRPVASCRFFFAVSTIIRALCTGKAWWQRVENGSSR